jgi:hypothetical protein
MINREASTREQVKQWLDECYNPDSAMSSTEKLTHAYRLLLSFHNAMEAQPNVNERTGKV